MVGILVCETRSWNTSLCAADGRQDTAAVFVRLYFLFRKHCSKLPIAVRISLTFM